MEAAAVLAIADGAATIIERLAPEIERLAKSGQITVEQQQSLAAKLDTLRSHSAFTGPEWEPAKPA